MPVSARRASKYRGLNGPYQPACPRPNLQPTDTPLNDLVARLSWADLDRAGVLTGDDYHAIDRLTAELAGMSDAQVKATFGINTPGMAGDLRALFNGTWREPAR